MMIQCSDDFFYIDPIWFGPNWYIKNCTFMLKAEKRMTEKSALKKIKSFLRKEGFKAKCTNAMETKAIFPSEQFIKAFTVDLKYLKAPPYPDQWFAWFNEPDLSDLRNSFKVIVASNVDFSVLLSFYGTMEKATKVFSKKRKGETMILKR